MYVLYINLPDRLSNADKKPFVEPFSFACAAAPVTGKSSDDVYPPM
jgi:hypothetical protein